MPNRRRGGALALAVLALALTVTGVVVAATDPNPAGVARDPLALNGYPPKSATLQVSVSNGSSVALSANVSVNFTNNRVDAIVHFPTASNSAAVEARLIADELYVRSANVSSGPWFGLTLRAPSLFGVALELTKPDLYLINGFAKSTSKSGYATTYYFTRHDVAVGSPLSSSSPSSLGSLLWSITTGSQGEVTASSLRVTSKRRVTTISIAVLHYNQSVSVARPLGGDVRALSASAAAALLRSQSFSSFVVPRNFLALPVTRLS